MRDGPLRLVYRGAFHVPWTTETHVAASLEALGHSVVRQHEETTPWHETVDAAEDADLLLFTSTFSFAARWPREEGFAALAHLRQVGIPTVFFHLDRWVGLGREVALTTEPWTACEWVFTADGDSSAAFTAAGIRHAWSPPAVWAGEVGAGTARAKFRSDVAFVGAHLSYGHPEWEPHRLSMLDAVRAVYGGRFRCWPLPGRRAVRGRDLNDLMASVRVVVGDSCLADRSTRYFSDRPFETVGRGGFLVMPAIAGLVELLPEGHGVVYFPPGDHAAMLDAIAYWVRPEADVERRAAIARGVATVRESHTYAHRLERVLGIVAGTLPADAPVVGYRTLTAGGQAV